MDADSTAPSTAVVVLERSTTADTTRVGAVARFVHVRMGQVDDRALRTVGASLELPAIGACTPLSASEEIAARGVELSEVGVVSIETSSGRAALTPRQVPDPVGRVSGVFYVGASEQQTVAPSSRVVLRVSGSQDVGAFAAQAQAPAELGDLRVAGQDLSRGSVQLAGGATDITWEASDDGRDVVYVDLSSTKGATRCAFADNGRAVVNLGDATEGVLAVHRLRREKFAARGVEPGELRFDFARVTSFSRR